jgi:2-C-methyl-D-erythritol 2,4-cyclodiphosphate synthase
MYRIGIGYDLHRLVPGRKLVLGGVDIPFHLGAAGHSDGDCLIHAVIDALLGAMGAGDIGGHFPDTDPRWKDARSTDLLARVMEIVREKGFEVVNVDTVVVAEAPRLGPYHGAIRDALCPILGIAPSDLGIKAKTAEGLGPVGEGSAIVCHALTLLRGCAS